MLSQQLSRPPGSPLFPYATLFRSEALGPDITLHFLALYADPRGRNLRNNLAHGLITRQAASRDATNWLIHSLQGVGVSINMGDIVSVPCGLVTGLPSLPTMLRRPASICGTSTCRVLTVSPSYQAARPRAGS